MSLETRERTVQLLRRLSGGDPTAVEELLPLLYDELRAVARRLLNDQRHATLQPTELIHEAYVRLVQGEAQLAFEDRRHFSRVAARAMRHVLVDRARARRADKRGAGRRPVTLDEALAASSATGESVLEVHDALEVLTEVDPQLAEIVELRFYAGLTMEQIAETLGVSRRTVQRAWRLVRAWWLEEYGKASRD